MTSKISNLHNQYDGEKLIIIGNGPSLSNVEFDNLKNHYTFAMNKIATVFDTTDWRPDFYLFQGNTKHNKYPEYAKKAYNEGCMTFIQKGKKDIYDDSDNIVFFNRIKCDQGEVLEMADIQAFHDRENANLDKVINKLWSTDIEVGFYSYFNSMITLCQIAAFIGFDELYFIGCDGYKEQRPYMIFDDGGDPVEFERAEGNLLTQYLKYIFRSHNPIRTTVNGFVWKILRNKKVSQIYYRYHNDKNYYDGTNHPDKAIKFGREYQKRNDRLNLVHDIIERAGKHYGFKTYNATPNSQLDIHKEVQLSKIIKTYN